MDVFPVGMADDSTTSTSSKHRHWPSKTLYRPALGAGQLSIPRQSQEQTRVDPHPCTQFIMNMRPGDQQWGPTSTLSIKRQTLIQPFLLISFTQINSPSTPQATSQRTGSIKWFKRHFKHIIPMRNTYFSYLSKSVRDMRMCYLIYRSHSLTIII